MMFTPKSLSFSVQQAERGHDGVPAQPAGGRQDPSGDDRHDQGQDEGLIHIT